MPGLDLDGRVAGQIQRLPAFLAADAELRHQHLAGAHKELALPQRIKGRDTLPRGRGGESFTENFFG